MFIDCYSFLVRRNGGIKQNNLSPPQIVRKPPSLSSSDEEEDREEEGQVTPLPGSTAELAIDTWPTDDDSQCEVHVTVIPTGQVSTKRDVFIFS